MKTLVIFLSPHREIGGSYCNTTGFNEKIVTLKKNVATDFSGLATPAIVFIGKTIDAAPMSGTQGHHTTDLAKSDRTRCHGKSPSFPGKYPWKMVDFPMAMLV